MISISRISAISAALVLLSGCGAHHGEPDCSFPWRNASSQWADMVQSGKGATARREAAKAEPCYEHEAGYWLNRAQLLPVANGDLSHKSRDVEQGIGFIDRAIELDTHNANLKQIKASWLFMRGKDQEVVSLYEQALSKVMNPPPNDQTLAIETQGVFDVAPDYIRSSRRLNRLDNARRRLSPFVARVCRKKPNYSDHYAKTIIWLDQQLNQKSPADVSEACSDFSS